MMQMMSTFVNDTFTMSYLGRVGFGNLEPYIDGIHIYTSGDRGMTIEMLSVDGRMVADLKQSFSSPLYLEALRKECAAIHLDVQVSEQICFDIPRDAAGNVGLLARLGDRVKRSIGNRIKTPSQRW
ncbi:MAG: hypothetical protein IJV22_04870 [Bacteroidales bacterium]|nr:hypothetical protein [Bacteroidales bacterium]